MKTSIICRCLSCGEATELEIEYKNIDEFMMIHIVCDVCNSDMKVEIINGKETAHLLDK